MDAELLVNRLKTKAAAQPTKVLFEYVNDDGVSLVKKTYRNFELETGSLARRLVKYKQKHGPAGNIALLVYPPGLDFIVAFVACLRAGVIAVPVYPPRGARNKDLAMFLAVHASCKAKLALTNSMYNFASRVASIKDTLGSVFGSRKEDDSLGKWPDDLEWVVTDSLSTEMAAEDEIDLAKAEDIAFLQYTSGSTSLPKGVVLTHGNLAHNLATIIIALKADESVVVVSWLPMYHDMGLIGSHLGTIYCGGTATIFSPIAFVKNPPMWLDLVSSRRGTHLQAPNFAYKLTVRKFTARQEKRPTVLDLSSVRHIFNAAEPIDSEAINEFCDVFGRFGLKRDAMIPGYGLAEHTVYVCDGGKIRLRVSRRALERDGRLMIEEASKPDTLVLVGCGAPPPQSNIRIVIVDPAKLLPLRDGLVGEIWLSSPSKASAYFDLEAKTKTDLKAKLASRNDELQKTRVESVDERRSQSDGSDNTPGTDVDVLERFIEPTSEELALEWLRTGDLGVKYETELFVCGRIKDLLIVRGRNHFPQDIEATVERSDRSTIRPGCSAAFTVNETGEEQVVVCLEVRASLTQGAPMDQLIQNLRTNVAREHGVSVMAVVLLAEHSIPKTTSGKISRYRVKHAYVQNKLKVVGSWRRSATELLEEDALEQEPDGKAKEPAPSRTTLRGAPLMQKLKEEAAGLLERDPTTLDENAPLSELGFDSMMLTQFKGAVLNVLGVELKDEELFDEKCTLNKVQIMVEQDDSSAPLVQDPLTAPADATPISNTKKSQKQPLFASWKPGQKCGFCGC